MHEMREIDRQKAYPSAVLETGADRSECRCCGYPTWKSGDDTCVLCDWSREISTGSGQPIDLTDARANFRKHMSAYPADDRPDWDPEPPSAETMQLRRELRTAYAAIARGRLRTWYRARALERQLSRRSSSKDEA